MGSKGYFCRILHSIELVMDISSTTHTYGEREKEKIFAFVFSL